ncbi:hypothetical protein H0H87_008228 [Tephrocybe sp. NHM501043]|nr:hypothetical protein H0H87_008228 [Tephrocybe sp. NHM501043]
MTAKDGRKVTIVIDAGKNFQAAALEWFPKYGLRQIDALLITHPHADVPQVPEFKWHIIDDGVTFEVLDTGIQVTPFSVHHGRVFSVAPPPAYIPSPYGTTPSTPAQSSRLLQLENEDTKKPTEIIHPYFCYGFKFGHELVYMSDVSHIPDDKWPIIESRRPDNLPLPVLVVDCLRLRPHTSHFGLENAIDTARRAGASRTYLTGFGHEVAHDEYVTLGEAVGGKTFAGETLTDTVKTGLEIIREGENTWVRPSHDGLRVFIEADGRVNDESY